VWDSSASHSHPSGFNADRPDGSVPVFAFAAAIALAIDGVILPWISWGFGYQDVSQFSTRYSLFKVMSSSGAMQILGADWMLLISAGIGGALAGSIVELRFRPAIRLPRLLVLGGFALAVVGSCIGLLVGTDSANGPSGVAATITISLELGFWIALVLEAVGAVLSVIHLMAPANPSKAAQPFEPSPWGPPPGEPPPGFVPPAADNWSDYVKRGQSPPGYIPPSYGPAVLPSPGFITPAYMTPGQPGPMFGPPVPGSGDLGQGQIATEGASGPGRLTVAESGTSRTLTVEAGQRLLVGRDVDAEVRVFDRKVADRHATIERRGAGWAVQDVDALKPTRLVDPWGMHRQIRGETEVAAGQVLVGDVVITLHPSHPMADA
jgi:hypothetical protein